MLKKLNKILIKFSQKTVVKISHPLSFISAFLLVISWAVTGPLFQYSTNWQLFINTLTTIVTFLLGFLILVSNEMANRSQTAKIDELIRVLGPQGARLELLESEKMTAEQISVFENEFLQQSISGSKHIV